jgi:hypothetical protein
MESMGALEAVTVQVRQNVGNNKIKVAKDIKGCTKVSCNLCKMKGREQAWQSRKGQCLHWHFVKWDSADAT